MWYELTSYKKASQFLFIKDILKSQINIKCLYGGSI